MIRDFAQDYVSPRLSLFCLVLFCHKVFVSVSYFTLLISLIVRFFSIVGGEECSFKRYTVAWHALWYLATHAGHLCSSQWFFDQWLFPLKVWGLEQLDTASTTVLYSETSPIHLLEIFVVYLVQHRDQINIQHTCCLVTSSWTNSLRWCASDLLGGMNVMRSSGNWRNFSFFAKAFGQIPH